MSVSMYQVTIPPATRALATRRHLPATAIAHCEAREIDPAAIVSCRLFPDMFPFASQIRIVSDMSKLCVSRLSGGERPEFADDEQTFAELDERLEKTLAYLGAAIPSQIDGTEERPITFKTRQGEVRLPAIDYVQKFVLPNVFSDTTTAYNILRYNGVDVGKSDFLGAL